ncbi:MAG: tRNA-specific adenosine deaminase [Phycisphaeraceae bacterium]|nr:tRNA-specific adenosine deaminase [Phycisphaeraceae bacterium]
MTAPTDEQMMSRALEQARRAADTGEVPVGAVVWLDGEVLAEAHNLRESRRDPTAHAEIVALRSAAQHLGSWRLEDATIAVTLEPCPMCVGALINARIRRLVYGAADPKMGCVHTFYELATDERFNHRLEVTRGVMAQECGAVLSEFFRRRRGRD